MAHVRTGVGRPVVFLHGNPTWGYLWRNIVPTVAKIGECFIPDLMGMGRSDRLERSECSFAAHSAFLDRWIEKTVQGQMVLVVHDWGSALGFDWARRNPERVAAIVHMESIVAPREWHDLTPDRTRIFRSLRGEEGVHSIIEENAFIEKVLPTGMDRKLEPHELDAYRQPFIDPQSRWPMLVFPRELPIGGEPAQIVDMVQEYSGFLASSPIPKLFINAEPGAIVAGRLRDIVRSWPNQMEVSVPGRHFVQEDSPREIATAIFNFLGSLTPPQSGAR